VLRQWINRGYRGCRLGVYVHSVGDREICRLLEHFGHENVSLENCSQGDQRITYGIRGAETKFKDETEVYLIFLSYPYLGLKQVGNCITKTWILP
jgi:hypothetical protein